MALQKTISIADLKAENQVCQAQRAVEKSAAQAPALGQTTAPKH
ncbi:hypothetical protein ABTZ57_01360 [Streptomyces sp. NPDC094048]